jgi:hypothetical protein
VAEPLPKFGAWGNFLQPEANICFHLCQTSRPEPVDKDTHPIFFVWRFIHTFDFDVHLIPVVFAKKDSIAREFVM